MTSEKYLEKALADFIKSEGGECRKFVSPGHIGVPDRLCFLPRGMLFLVETKSTGDKTRPSQVREHERLKALGFKVFVVSTEQELTQFKETVWTTQSY